MEQRNVMGWKRGGREKANLDLELGVGDVVGAVGAQLVESGIRRRALAPTPAHHHPPLVDLLDLLLVQLGRRQHLCGWILLLAGG